MEKLKKYWREILIVILAILFISNCTGKGNYKRKYDKQVQRTEFVHDSLKSMYGNSLSIVDSLNHEIKSRDEKIVSLESQIDIYKDQNNKLANKPVVVRVNQDKK
jgi:predicted RND superfamily exporter protein